MSKIIKTLIIFIGFFVVSSAFSYTPNLDMILSRVARNHGYGHYLIEQVVLLKSENEQIKLTEYWVVKDENTMYLKVTGIKGSDEELNIFYVYNRGSRYSLGAGGRVRKPLPKEWMGRLLTFRNMRSIKPYLYSLKLIPAEGLKSSKNYYSKGKLKYDPVEYVHLARSGKKIAYAIGASKEKNMDLKSPGIWVEQDQFNVLKVRFPSQVFVEAGDYFKTVGLWYPKTLTYSWDNKKAYIKTKLVKRVSPGKKMKAKLNYRSLNKKNAEEFETRLSQSALLKEFYDRFR